MPLLSSGSWSSAAATSMLGILIVVAVVLAVVLYVGWSSDANLAQFMSRPMAAAASTSVLPVRGRSGCGRADKPLPALSLPLE
ncbi:hypothetical protein [Bradyrhizobium tropiciagri]|uniref:hypothetical protein n=1 Tax=Bradyrhizobium tropiciagri TaxID=312253 RepID=UPI00067AB728|nr:hypothetical protein [Bradyrhizobium tropiciagri]